MGSNLAQLGDKQLERMIRREQIFLGWSFVLDPFPNHVLPESFRFSLLSEFCKRSAGQCKQSVPRNRAPKRRQYGVRRP